MRNFRLIHALLIFSLAPNGATAASESSSLQDGTLLQGPAAQLAELSLAPNETGYRLGTSVAVSVDTVVVGTTFGSLNGAAYVYVKPASGWSYVKQSAVLVPSDQAGCEDFGASVSVSGDTIVIGAPQNAYCSSYGPGAAYVYVKPAGGWCGQLTETAKLTASDGAVLDALGTSVSNSGDTVVAGAPSTYPFTTGGAAYVFVEPPNGWTSATENAKLTASDGKVGDELGASVSISGPTVAAGAPNHGAGTAYVFVEPAKGWASITQTAELTSLTGSSNDGLGTSIAIHGNNLAAGAPNATVGSNVNQGAVYLFVKPPSGWTNEAEKANLIAPDGRSGDYFGSAVAINQSRVAVGAPRYSRGQILYFDYPVYWLEGAVYEFRKVAGKITTVSVMHGSDARYDDLLGSSVGIDGNLVISGAPSFSRGLGSAYLFGVQ